MKKESVVIASLLLFNPTATANFDIVVANGNGGYDIVFEERKDLTYKKNPSNWQKTSTLEQQAIIKNSLSQKSKTTVQPVSYSIDEDDLHQFKKLSSYTIEPEDIQKKISNKKTTLFPFSVNVTPSDANVRVMNIAPKYRDGIKLKKGLYDIEVSQPGYRTQRFWTELNSVFNKVDVNLNKVGSLKCDNYEINESGSIFKPYGSQVQIVDILENVTISEVYSSLLDHFHAQNYLHDYKSAISGDYAYINFNYSPLSKEDIDMNRTVSKDSSRQIREFIGIESIPNQNKVKLITHIELPEYTKPSSIGEYYCKMIEAI